MKLFLYLLSLVLITLKLLHLINYSWLEVLTPLIINFCLYIIDVIIFNFME